MVKQNGKELSEKARKIGKKLLKNKYVLAVLVLGAVLVLWPTKSDSKSRNISDNTNVGSELSFSLEEQEKRIAQVLSQIDGAGNVEVVLTLKTSIEKEIAIDEESSSQGDDVEEKQSAVIVSTGSGIENAVVTKYIYPDYRGALVVSEGAGNPNVKLQITNAVASLTGLTTDKITVVKMK